MNGPAQNEHEGMTLRKTNQTERKFMNNEFPISQLLSMEQAGFACIPINNLLRMDHR
jgi:hypothetical protein